MTLYVEYSQTVRLRFWNVRILATTLDLYPWEIPETAHRSAPRTLRVSLTTKTLLSDRIRREGEPRQHRAAYLRDLYIHQVVKNQVRRNAGSVTIESRGKTLSHALVKPAILSGTTSVVLPLAIRSMTLKLIN